MSLWTRTQHRATEAGHTHDIKAAYDKGRRDERANRKRHPFVMTGLVVLAMAGASLITLAGLKGSFGAAGEVADHKIAVAAQSAAPVVEDAVSNAADAARDTGESIKDKGRELTSRDKG